MERIAASGPGRMEIAGRWFGIRGRRFMRPALTLRPTAGGSEVRALADLAHKPWSAQDGDVWMAAFDIDPDTGDAAEIELSVAPDIAVALRRPGRKPAGPGDRLTAGKAARSPVAKAVDTPKPSRRPSRTGPAEQKRLRAELASATQALALERERRGALDQALEDERAIGRELRTELAKVRAELDLAHAAQAQAAAAAAELEAARAQLREAQRQHEELMRERDRTTEAHDAATTSLHERSGALESAREALAAEQAETARLRAQLARAEQTGSGAPTHGEQSGSRAPARSRADTGRHDRPDTARQTGRHDRPDTGRQGSQGVAARAPRRGKQVDPQAGPRGLPVPSHPQRPLNPSLRHRTWWLGRLLALVFLLVVLAAIYVVIHSTIKH